MASANNKDAIIASLDIADTTIVASISTVVVPL